MAAVVGVRFKNAGKLYYFDPGKLWPVAGCFVIVETARGVEYGQVITGVRQVEEELIAAPLKPVLRIADDADAEHSKENATFEKEAYQVCQHKIDEHNLDMKLVGVEQTFDNAKILFYFTANGRVDFRSLVKDLAAVFHTRIELRQIGVRDEAKMLGGLGPCGRPICCGSFLGDFQPVSIKMAKEQNLSLNPTKISGVCGRLMCCLKFEQDHYEATRKRMPKMGKSVETPDGYGIVLDVNVLKETVLVRVHKGDSSEMKNYALEDVKWVGTAQPSQQMQAQPIQAQPPIQAQSRQPMGEGHPYGDQHAEPRGRAQARRVGRPAVVESAAAVRMVKEEASGMPVAMVFEDEVPPAEQSNDWRRAVEDALNAAQDKE